MKDESQFSEYLFFLQDHKELLFILTGETSLLNKEVNTCLKLLEILYDKMVQNLSLDEDQETLFAFCYHYLLVLVSAVLNFEYNFLTNLDNLVSILFLVELINLHCCQIIAEEDPIELKFIYEYADKIHNDMPSTKYFDDLESLILSEYEKGKIDKLDIIELLIKEIKYENGEIADIIDTTTKNQ